MTATYFLSDLHLDHQNICKFRTRFTDVKEHNEYIKNQYHKVVKPNDTVYFLGDVAFSKKSLLDLKSWNGVKHIVLGNHDVEFKKRDYTFKDLQDVFGDNIYGFIRKYNMWLSHCPIHEDELRGRVNLYGHTHSHLINDDRYLSVCMEHIDYTPISLEQIRLKLKSRGIVVK